MLENMPKIKAIKKQKVNWSYNVSQLLTSEVFPKPPEALCLPAL